uniref:Uncharacterized protein LOC101491068 n=1 Tax=Cicer arietinum TaxID=3827 RepID=A0A1S2XBB5_CICAR|nr:uncharacterized protein LOC101491068 [Cicer arietinum]
MRRSYIEPSMEKQEGVFSSDYKQSEDSTKMKNPSTSSYDKAKKEEDYVETNKKKLERKPTEDINASADAFIKNFRQQLIIQRLQSIENYEKMLARGL